MYKQYRAVYKTGLTASLNNKLHILFSFPHYHSSEIAPTTLKLLFIVTNTPASSKSPTRNLYPFLSLHNEVLCNLIRLWALPILPVCHILNSYLLIPSTTKHDQAPPSITGSPKYSDSA